MWESLSHSWFWMKCSKSPLHHLLHVGGAVLISFIWGMLLFSRFFIVFNHEERLANHLLIGSCDFCPLVCSCQILHLLVCIYWITLYCQMKATWCLWIIYFKCWTKFDSIEIFLHPCSSRRWIYNKFLLGLWLALTLVWW